MPELKDRQITLAQAATLFDKYDNMVSAPPIKEFLETIYWPLGCDGAIAFPIGGFHLIIERDGYAHS